MSTIIHASFPQAPDSSSDKPVVAILTVSYRHWLEHRGSEGIADLLEPAPGTSGTVVKVSPQGQKHPLKNTTAEDMARARPDLTTGELKLPIEE